MSSVMDRIEKDVLQGKQRTKNRVREHAGHGWTQEGRWTGNIVLMCCPCGWLGWLPTDAIK